MSSFDWPRTAGVNGGTEAPEPRPDPPHPTADPVPSPPEEPPAPEPGDPGPQPPDDEPVPQAASWPLKHVGPDDLTGIPFAEQKALDDYLERQFKADIAAIKESGEKTARMAERGIRFEAACKALLACEAVRLAQLAKALSYLLPDDLDGNSDVRKELSEAVASSERALRAD